LRQGAQAVRGGRGGAVAVARAGARLSRSAIPGEAGSRRRATRRPGDKRFRTRRYLRRDRAPADRLKRVRLLSVSDESLRKRWGGLLSNNTQPRATPNFSQRETRGGAG